MAKNILVMYKHCFFIPFHLPSLIFPSAEMYLLTFLPRKKFVVSVGNLNTSCLEASHHQLAGTHTEQNPRAGPHFFLPYVHLSRFFFCIRSTEKNDSHGGRVVSTAVDKSIHHTHTHRQKKEEKKEKKILPWNLITKGHVREWGTD